MAKDKETEKKEEQKQEKKETTLDPEFLEYLKKLAKGE